MGLIREAAREAVKQLTPLPGTGTWGSRWTSGLPRERSYSSLVGEGMKNSIVAATVLWIARQFPKAPVMLERRNEKGLLQPVVSHPFLKLLSRPNPSYSGVLLWWAVMVSFLTDGNGYKLKRRNEAGRVVEEWYVPHWMIEPKWPPDGTKYLSHYLYQPGVGSYKLDPKDVVHYRYGLDPDNIRLGRSPLKSLLREVYTDEEAARFTAALLHNLGMPGVIISPGAGQEGSVSDPEAQAVKAKYQQEFGGDKRGQVMVMRGSTEIKTIGFNPQELDLGRLREIPEERVTSVLGVPAAVVGLGTGLQQTKVGATMAELRQMGWEDGIIPLHMLLADEMETQELSEFESDLDPWVIGFDRDQVPELQDAQDEKAKRWGELVRSGIAMRSEGRSAFDLPVATGDQVYLQPMGILETEAPAVQKDAPTPEVKGRKAPAADARYLRALDRIVRRVSGLMAGDLELAFDRLGERAQVAYVAAGDGRQASLASRKQDGPLATRIIQAMRIETWQATNLAPIYTRYIDAVAEATYGAVSQRIGLGVAWDIEDPLAQQVLASGGTRLGMLDLSAETRASILRAIEEGRAAGEGPVSIARRIRDDVPAGPYREAGAKYRAELIARTETLHAQRASTLAAGQSAGFEEYLIFDARLGDTDDECELLDQQVVSLEEAEQLMDEEHPNGTRSFSPVPRTSGQEEAARQAPTKFGTPGEHPFTHGVVDGWRCSSCNAKLAEAAGPGTVQTCRKCKTVNRVPVPQPA